MEKILKDPETKRKLFWINGLFLLIFGLVFLGVYKNERERALVLPIIPEVSEASLVPTAIPERLIIPSLRVNAAIQKVGVTVSGNMAAPTYYKDAAWFKLGAAPGASGSAVIAGHLDTKGGAPAVFSNLKDLKVGDEILVRNEDGEKIRFVVDGTMVVDYNDPTAEVTQAIFSQSSVSRLILITCDGTWLPELKTYTDRLIVISHLDSSPESDFVLP